MSSSYQLSQSSRKGAVPHRFRTPRLSMCGIVPKGICRFSELATGQFGLTKQLVLRVALPHISLLVISSVYALMGCWILTAINHNDDGSADTVRLIVEAKSKFVVEFLKHHSERLQSSTSAADNRGAQVVERRSRGEEAFLEFAKSLHTIYVKRPNSPTVVKSIKGSQYFRKELSSPQLNVGWNLFFAVTCLTSIGYGANAPISWMGRLFCVFYIAFGIPLYLITLADMAKFCTEGINRAYTEFIQFRHQLLCRWRFWWRRKRRKLSAAAAAAVRRRSVHINSLIIAGGEEELAEFLWTHLEKTKFVEVPFFLIYAILLAYIGFASYLIARLEQWPLVDSFYFVMTTVLTIGFGDLMPSNDDFLLLTLFTVLTGLIVTTTCIDIVGAHYIDRLHFFGRRLDSDDPIKWLKAVQQKRIEAMKREAFKKLFETVTALHRMHLTGMKKLDEYPVPLSAGASYSEASALFPSPSPPRSLHASHPTAESIRLRWDPPVYLQEGRRFWYTLSFKTRTPQRRNPLTIIDFITRNEYEVRGLKSFTLYEFSLATQTRFGCSKAVRVQEYTEPCTVPQLLKLDGVSSESATLSWQAPSKNNGQEVVGGVADCAHCKTTVQNYTLMYAQEPAPQFQYWQRFKAGRAKRFTLSGLRPGTRYMVCVVASHNFGLAAMSKSLRFKTRKWWYDGEVGDQGGEDGETEQTQRRCTIAESTAVTRGSIAELVAGDEHDPSFLSPRTESGGEKIHKISATSSEYSSR